MTSLRQKLIDELALRGLSPRTRDSYVAAVRQLARYYQAAPDALSEEQIKSYLLHLVRERGFKPNSMNVHVSALRFFYETVLGRSFAEVTAALPRMKRAVKRPQVYAQVELERLFKAPRLNPKHRVLLMTAYAAGLRVSELCRLTPQDILSERMQIRVIEGKGRKDRYTVLSSRLLAELRDYWRKYRPRRWLFPTQTQQDKPITTRTAQRVFRRAVALAELQNRGGIHALRHSFATHLLECGVDLPVLQRLLGHRSLSATVVYLHVANTRLAQVRSPLDLIDFAALKTA